MWCYTNMQLFMRVIYPKGGSYSPTPGVILLCNNNKALIAAHAETLLIYRLGQLHPFGG